jgi:hypothetical protein
VHKRLENKEQVMASTAVEEEGPKMPKFEYKMLLFPVLMLATRQIDFKNEEVLDLSRKSMYGVIVAVLSLYFLLYQV